MTARVACQQSRVGDCPGLSGNDLGRSDMYSTDGLVPRALLRGDSSKDDLPGVRIYNFTIVCETAGMRRNTVSSASVIVDYEHCVLSPTCTSPTRVTRQFDFDCRPENTFFPPYKALGSVVNTDNPVGTLATALKTKCMECAKPAANLVSDAATHCARKFFFWFKTCNNCCGDVRPYSLPFRLHWSRVWTGKVSLFAA